MKRLDDDRGDAIPDKLTLAKVRKYLSDWKLWAYGGFWIIWWTMLLTSAKESCFFVLHYPHVGICDRIQRCSFELTGFYQTPWRTLSRSSWEIWVGIARRHSFGYDSKSISLRRDDLTIFSERTPLCTTCKSIACLVTKNKFNGEWDRLSLACSSLGFRTSTRIAAFSSPFRLSFALWGWPWLRSRKITVLDILVRINSSLKLG